MPDKYGFNHLVERGLVTLRCIDCDEGGKLYKWPEEKRMLHFLTHYVPDGGSRAILSGEIRTDNCRICGESFEQERKRGRPRVLCYVCKPDEKEAIE